MEPRPKKLEDQVREAIRVKRYSYRTEESYVYWIRRFILFHNKRHPQEMGTAEVTHFLTHLAVKEQVSASTQNQAMNAIVFLYRVVLQQELVGIDAIRVKRSRYLPTVLTPDEVHQVIQQLHGVPKLVIQILYGSGLRLSERLQLGSRMLILLSVSLWCAIALGKESRVTMLPTRLIDPLQAHLQVFGICIIKI